MATSELAAVEQATTRSELRGSVHTEIRHRHVLPTSSKLNAWRDTNWSKTRNQAKLVNGLNSSRVGSAFAVPAGSSVGTPARNDFHPYRWVEDSCLTRQLPPVMSEQATIGWGYF